MDSDGSCCSCSVGCGLRLESLRERFRAGMPALPSESGFAPRCCVGGRLGIHCPHRVRVSGASPAGSHRPSLSGAASASRRDAPTESPPPRAAPRLSPQHPPAIPPGPALSARAAGCGGGGGGARLFAISLAVTRTLSLSLPPSLPFSLPLTHQESLSQSISLTQHLPLTELWESLQPRTEGRLRARRQALRRCPEPVRVVRVSRPSAAAHRESHFSLSQMGFPPPPGPRGPEARASGPFPLPGSQTFPSLPARPPVGGTAGPWPARLLSKVL